MVARLYFTEPEHLDELTHLRFQAKYPESPEWRRLQDAEMAAADRLIDEHFGM